MAFGLPSDRKIELFFGDVVRGETNGNQNSDEEGVFLSDAALKKAGGSAARKTAMHRARPRRHESLVRRRLLGVDQLSVTMQPLQFRSFVLKVSPNVEENALKSTPALQETVVRVQTEPAQTTNLEVLVQDEREDLKSTSSEVASVETEKTKVLAKPSLFLKDKSALSEDSIVLDLTEEDLAKPKSKRSRVWVLVGIGSTVGLLWCLRRSNSGKMLQRLYNKDK
eukprot:TRINITY_DN2603_c0_g1_i1.p1 TRINITY_DN2603_c0_g1~~TRINITY_DN2603_c0_g1_i1.p1  ORF type:complete len:258 (-),score=64.09 TRINITY_DN2603_c0_g1_i1:36-707(-)